MGSAVGIAGGGRERKGEGVKGYSQPKGCLHISSSRCRVEFVQIYTNTNYYSIDVVSVANHVLNF